MLDPLRRLALDAQYRLQAAKKQRFAAYDNKRQNMVTELEERERQFKRARREKEQDKVARETENDRIREEGRRIREQREIELQALERERAKSRSEPEETTGEDAVAPPPLGDLDTTIRIKYSLSSHSTLSTASALASYYRRYGEIDDGAVVMSQKVKKPKKSKGQTEGETTVTALVPFNQLGAAFGVISSAASLKEQGMDVAWAGGSEPPILSWLREGGDLGGTASQRAKSPQTPPTSDGTIFSSFPSSFVNYSSVLPLSSQLIYLCQPSFDDALPQPSPVATAGMDYESLTLLRMREAERARLEKEILEAEADGSIHKDSYD